MQSPRVWTAIGTGLIGLLVLPSCGQAVEPTVTEAAPLDVFVEPPPPAVLPALPDAVIATRETILDAVEARSLRRLGRFAESQDAFLSNLGNDDHYTHWYLMRATGFDVLRKLDDLFDQPYGVRMVGTETWFVWPDVATLDREPLVLETLSFSDRARLTELIGEEGIEAMERGEPYPGIRTAIAENGGWRYFLHENGMKEGEND